MKFTYLKLTNNAWKLFYEAPGRYGEMFFNFEDDGTAEIVCKDPDYASALLAGLEEELTGKKYAEPQPENDREITYTREGEAICHDCGEIMNEHTEQRDGGHSETLLQCPKCG